MGLRGSQIPAYGMAYHDTLLMSMVAAGKSLDECKAMLLDDELYPPEFIEMEIAISIQEMQRREEGDLIDIKFSPFLLEFALAGQVFHVTNHPCRPALAYVANRILRQLGYKGDVPSVGKELIPFPHVPVPPPVRSYLNAQGHLNGEWRLENEDLYHLPSGNLTRQEYIVLAYEHLCRYDQAQLEASLNERPIRNFLERFARKDAGVSALHASA